MYRLLLLLLPFLLFSCREPRTATSCSGVNQSNSANTTAADPARDPHFFKRRKKVKAEDGFKQKDRKSRRAVKKAEKGKKQQRKETKSRTQMAFFQKEPRCQNRCRLESQKQFEEKRTQAKEINQEKKTASADGFVSEVRGRVAGDT